MIFIFALIGLILLGLSITVILGIGYSIHIYSIESYISYFFIFLSFISFGILTIIWVVYIDLLIESKSFLLRLRYLKFFNNVVSKIKCIRIIFLSSFILIVIGTIGSAISGIYVIQNLANSVGKKIDYIHSNEKQILKTINPIRNLNLNFSSEEYDIEFRKSIDSYTYIKGCDYTNSEINIEKYYDNSSKTFNIKFYECDEALNSLSLKNGIEDFLVEKYINSNCSKKIIIEVPNKVNININSLGKTGKAKINIRDKDILSDKFTLKDVNSELNIPYFNSLKEINIKDMEDVRLDLRSIINTNNIDIKGVNVKLYSGGDISDYNLDNIPDYINIVGKNIEITSFIPLGKSSNLYSENWMYFQMPFNDYGLYGSLTGLKYIDNKQVQSGDLITLINTNFYLKNNMYIGNYSNNKSKNYKMDITLTEGVIVNSLYSIIEDIILQYE